MSTPRFRLAFDLDETLGVALTDGLSLTGFQLRDGCIELLEELAPRVELVLWTVSSRRYLNKVLATGLHRYFRETWSWDEMPCEWKDIRRIKVDGLVDDSAYYRERAAHFGIADRYLVIPAVGSREDRRNPLLWSELVTEWLEEKGV